MKTILLYGDSIFLSGLTTRLQNLPDVTVRQQAPQTSPLQLSGLDAVIVDFDAVEAADILALLRVRPDLRVVGVSPSNSVVTVLAGQVYLAETTQDVMRVIDRNALNQSLVGFTDRPVHPLPKA